MEFVKEFAIFLHKKGIIKFGNFTLASGKTSSYYVDLRLVPSHPIEFRKMIKHLQDKIIRDVKLDNFDSVVGIPTGGLVFATALATESLKPLIYVRDKPKEYGTLKMVEGEIHDGMRAVMIDDVANTGDSVVAATKSLKKVGVSVRDVFVIINRMEGAEQVLSEMGVKMHSVLSILEVAETLYEQELIDKSVLEELKRQINS